MTTITRRRANPVAEMLNWLEDPGLRGLGLVPDIRVEDYVDGDTYVVRAEIPGIDPDKDLDVHLEGDQLVVRGERREEEHDKTRREFHYGSFYRSMTVPPGAKVEDIRATYTDGVLEVRLPVDGAAEEPRHIAVQRSTK